ncbi:MAG TPA: tetratricopeptide repeat protein [Bacillota bacterium]|nr:tetratricopeptide repeat protein [Bacillota bacterium]
MGLAWPTAARAHGDLHDQIEALSREIEKEPRSADLWLRRGELHRAHGEYDPAQADYEQALALDPKLIAVYLARGRMFVEANWPVSAKAALDRYLDRHPDHVDARTLRARALVKLKQYLAAAKDYSHAIDKSTPPKPDTYLERADALKAAGSAYYAEAVRGLDEGLRRLGPVVTLQLYAIDLEAKQGRFDAALARLDRAAAQANRQETWLARRGEILRDAGRLPEARRAWQQALEEIAKLPSARRNVPAMLELEKALRAALEVTATQASPGTNAPPATAPALSRP